MENPEIPGRIQWNGSSRSEFSGKKINTFRGITFLPKRPKFSVPFVWITSVRLHVERKRKIYRYFVNSTTQFRSCVLCQKHIPVPFERYRNFRKNGKRSNISRRGLKNNEANLHKKQQTKGL